MKRIIFIAATLLFTSVLHAQNDSTFFYKHEVRASVGGAICTSWLWLQEDACLAYFSFAYYYRPVKWFWVGMNFANCFGNKLDYYWREYYLNGTYRDFSKSKLKYCAMIAPEIRFSFMNNKWVSLYGALSGGVGIEDGYDDVHHKYPHIFPCWHVTFFGISVNFGKNKNIFLGNEIGFGYKGILNIHGGYRF